MFAVCCLWFAVRCLRLLRHAFAKALLARRAITKVSSVCRERFVCEWPSERRAIAKVKSAYRELFVCASLVARRTFVFASYCVCGLFVLLPPSSWPSLLLRCRLTRLCRCICRFSSHAGRSACWTCLVTALAALDSLLGATALKVHCAPASFCADAESAFYMHVGATRLLLSSIAFFFQKLPRGRAYYLEFRRVLHGFGFRRSPWKWLEARAAWLHEIYTDCNLGEYDLIPSRKSEAHTRSVHFRSSPPSREIRISMMGWLRMIFEIPFTRQTPHVANMRSKPLLRHVIMCIGQ